MIQRTDEWYASRCGKVTASKIGDLMAKTKTGYSTSRQNYMADLVIERLTGCVNRDTFFSSAMQWGIDTEPQAKEAYEFKTFEQVDDIGFVDHPTILNAGASPDGLIGTEGLIEIKCPNSATHLETILTKKISKNYIYQMQFQMACTGREWCDFVSYDPRMPEKLQLFVKRIERDNEMITEIENEVKMFLDELNEKIKKLEEV
jgi:putative phage-type endonuclease